MGMIPGNGSLTRMIQRIFYPSIHLSSHALKWIWILHTDLEGLASRFNGPSRQKSSQKLVLVLQLHVFQYN
jgi:hypothetical protein